MRKIRELFERAEAGGTIVIPPAEYRWDGEIPLRSGMHVIADGAVFRFPEALPAPHVRMFAGQDLRGFSWHGGTFVGAVYDPANEANPWEPNAETAAIAIDGGADLTSTDIRGESLAGPLV